MKLQEIKAKVFRYLGLDSVSDLKKWMKQYGVRLDLRTRSGWIRLANIIWYAVSCHESAYPIEHVVRATFDAYIKHVSTDVSLADTRLGKEIGKVIYG